MRTIIAGGRDFQDYELLEKTCSSESISTVLSGHARGADQLGERYAFTRQLPVELFPADWDGEGRAAGFNRNLRMAQAADALIAFWNGASRGTAHMIKAAKAYGLKVKVVYYVA